MNNFSYKDKFLAFSVHIFTSTGILTGFLSLRAIHLHQWQAAMLWLFAGLLIDGLDGTFARKFRTQEVLPGWDGKAIDYVIDFVNYAFVPAFFFYEANLVPGGWSLPLTGAILLVSALYYGKTGMVTNDLYFEGFPVLWNGAMFYLFFVWNLPPWGNVIMVSLFCVLHFVPLKYIYPSRTVRFRWLNIGCTILFFVANLWILALYPEGNAVSLAVISTVCVGVMWGLGIYQTYWGVPAPSGNSEA